MIGVRVTGRDGSIWDLRNGPVVLGPGAEGFGLPKFSRPTVSVPALDGQRLQSIGSRAEARTGILPAILTPQDTDYAWLTVQRAWWAAWSPDEASRIEVTDPNGGVRTIRAYLDSDDGYGLDLEPSITLFERLPVSWVADDPWWVGPVQSTNLSIPTGGDWLVGGTAPPFEFQTAAQVGSATLTNPGEVAAWPRYTVSSGATSFSITVAGATISGTIAVPANRRLVIDANPSAQTALLVDPMDVVVANVTPQLSAVNFAPVPVGGNVPIATTLTGSNGASITVELTPRYRRAY